MTQPNPESLPIIADYSVKAVLRQLTESDTMAGRGYQVAGFASVVMGLAAIPSGNHDWLRAIIAVYVATVLACLIVLLPRWYFTPGAPKDLWKLHWNMPPEAVSHWLVAVSVVAYERNASATRRRAWALLVAVAGLAIQTGLVGVRLL